MRTTGFGCVLILAGLGSAAGCMPYATVPLTVGPTRHMVNSGGASVGIAYGRSSDDGSTETLLQVPTGEGSVRIAMGKGQLELRMRPDVAYAALRFDVLKDTPVEIALKPGVGFGYGMVRLSGDGDEDVSETMMSLVGYADVIFFFADRHAYVAPRLGYSMTSIDADAYGSADTTDNDILAYGGAAGYIVETGPFECAFELGLMRMDNKSDDVSDPAPLYMGVASVGIQFVGDGANGSQAATD